MDCVACKTKVCRTGKSCKAGSFSSDEILETYKDPANQIIVQTAAKLVDNGRAGTLSRLDEIIEYSRLMQLNKIGLAYCYGMESQANEIVQYVRKHNIKVVPVSCTTGGLLQSRMNNTSKIEKVACNPIAQASQLNSEMVDLTITMGLCLGHDILFNRHIESDVTTLVVKDRVHNHNPLLAIK